MRRWTLAVVCLLGWLVLVGAVVAPLVGLGWAAAHPGWIDMHVVGEQGAGELACRSLVLSGVAAAGALALGVLPAAVLGSCSRRAWPWLFGLVLAPLIVPPQVYAYAWGLLGSNDQSRWQGGAVRAGLVSAGWLWPMVSLVLAAGWRATGRGIYQLALLDASPLRAFVRVVLPGLRSHVVAAGCLVAGITLIEYAIPHLLLCRVWSTDLMLLVDVRAPARQVMRMAVQPMATVALLTGVAAWVSRLTGGWMPISEEDATYERVTRLKSGPLANIGWLTWVGAGLVWAASLGLPVGLMLANLRAPRAWIQGLAMFSPQWTDSLQVAGVAGVASLVVALATVAWWQAAQWKPLRWGAWLSAIVAVVPPPALGVGFVVAFNRPGLIGDAYAQTPLVWILALTARYGAVAVLLTWLAVGRRGIVAVEQARVDGGTGLDILGHVTLPLIWPSLVAAGLIVALLALFEVVVTQMVVPPAFGSIGMTILNAMHYGRDDAVITCSVTLMACGVLLTQVCAHFLSRAGRD